MTSETGAIHTIIGPRARYSLCLVSLIGRAAGCVIDVVESVDAPANFGQ